MANNSRKENFAQKLCTLYENFYKDDFDVNAFSNDIMSAFLHLSPGALHHERYGEITEYGKAVGNDPDEEIYGFKIKGKDIFLGSVLNQLERMQLPDEVLERYPDMTQEEWCAAIRMATFVIGAFSPAKPIIS